MLLREKRFVKEKSSNIFKTKRQANILSEINEVHTRENFSNKKKNHPERKKLTLEEMNGYALKLL